MGKQKPKFDPTKPFDVVETEAKPKFDPNQPFTVVQKKSEDESEVGTKDLSQPAKQQKPLSESHGSLLVDAEEETPVEVVKPKDGKVDFSKDRIDNGFFSSDNTKVDTGISINDKDRLEQERIQAEKGDKEIEAESAKIDNGVSAPMNFLAKINQQIYGIPSTISESLAMGGTFITNNLVNPITGNEDVKLEDDPVYKAAQWYRESIAELSPTNPAYANDLDTQVAGALGDLGALVLTGGISRTAQGVNELQQFTKASNLFATGAREAGKLLKTPPALVGAMQMGTSEYKQAKEAGATDDEAFGAFIKNAGVGSVLEAIPIMKFFNRLDKTTGGGVRNYIKKSTVQGVEEMTTEVAQQMFSNVSAAESYDATRKWYDGMTESGGIGFGLGFLLGGMGTSLRKKQSEAKTPEEKAEIQKAIDFVESKGEELKIQEESKEQKIQEAYKPGDTVELSPKKNEEINTQGEATENSVSQQVPISEEVAPVEEVKEEPTGIEAGLSEETKTAIDKEINFLEEPTVEEVSEVQEPPISEEVIQQEEPVIKNSIESKSKSEIDPLKAEALIKAQAKNSLIDKVNEYNSNLKSKNANELRQSIIKGSKEQGFTIGSNKGKITLVDSNGSKVNKTPIKQDKSAFVSFDERPQEVKDFYIKFEQEGNLDIAGTVDVGKFDIGLSEKEFQKAKIDIKNGVKSVPAETLLNFVENVHKNGYIPFSIGEGSLNQKVNIPLDEFVNNKVSDKEVDDYLNSGDTSNNLAQAIAGYASDSGDIDWARLKQDIDNDPDVFSGFVHDLTPDEFQTLKDIVYGQEQNKGSSTVDQNSEISEQAQAEKSKQGRDLQSIRDKARDARDSQDPEKAKALIKEIDGILMRENIVAGDDASFADPSSATFFDFLDQNKSVYLLNEDTNIAQSKEQLQKIIDSTPGAKDIDLSNGLSFDDAFDTGVIDQAKNMGFDGIRMLEIDGTNSTLQIWNFNKLTHIDGPELISSPPPPTPPKTINDETDGENQDLSGIKKALVSDEIIAGVDLEKISDKDMQALAGKIIATNEVVPEAIVNEILEKPRALQPKEVVALIHYKAFLDNKLRDAYKEKNRLFEEGEDTGTIDAEINDTEKLVENFDIVAVITASQQSLAFRLRKGMLDRDYNLVLQINKYKSVNKGVIPADVEAKFRELDKKLKDVNEQLEEAEKRAKIAEEELALKNIKESVAREKVKTNIKAASKDLASKIRKAKFHKPGIFSSATPVTVLVDLALETSASIIEAGGTIAQAVSEGWAIIKKSDWYKGLNKDKKVEAERAFTEMVSPSDIQDERLRIPNSIIRQAVEEGNDTIEDVTKYIKEAIKDDYPNITDREVRDAITKYGKVANMSKDEIDIQIRKIKRIGKIISSMEDVANKKRPLRSGLQRDKLDAEERALNKQLKESMRELPIDAETEARQLKTSLDAVKSRLTNQIEDLTREIETGEKSSRAKGVPYDQEAKVLIEERDKVKALHDEVFGKNELTDEQRLDRALKSTERSIAETDRRISEKDLEIKKSKPVNSAELKEAKERLSRSKEALKKLQEDAGIPAKKRLEQAKKAAHNRIEQLQDKLKNNDFSKRTPKPLIADTELTKLQAEKLKIQDEFDKAQYKNELKNRTLLQKWADVGLEVFSSLWRGLAASIDLSAVFVQGLLPTVRHPKDALYSLKEMFKQLASEKYQMQVMANIKSQEWYPALKASKLAITEIDGKYNAREELFVSNWIDAIWDAPARLVEKAINKNKFSDVWKKANPYKAANRAYTGYLNSMRILRFLDGAKFIESQGKTFDSHPEEYKAWADYVNNATGRGGLGPLENSAKALSLVFFSPRKLMSGLNLFTPYSFIYFGKMPKAMRQKAIMDYASSLAILTTTAILWEAAIKGMDDDEEDWGVFWDPNSTDFLKPKIENTRIDLFGGRQQQLVVMSRLITGEFVDSKGEVTKLGDRFGKDVNTRWDVVQKFFSNKFTPSLSFGKKVLDQKKGADIDWETESVQQVMPIWIRDVQELYKDHPIEIAIMLNLMTVFGVGVQTYGTTKRKNETPEERKERLQEFKEREKERIQRLKEEREK